jgi:hypothetical protein
MCRTASKLVKSLTGTISGTAFILSSLRVDTKDEKLYCIQQCDTCAYNTYNMILDSACYNQMGSLMNSDC